MALTKKGLVRKAAAKKSAATKKIAVTKKKIKKKIGTANVKVAAARIAKTAAKNHGEGDLGKENRGSHAIESNRQENDCEEEGGKKTASRSR